MAVTTAAPERAPALGGADAAAAARRPRRKRKLDLPEGTARALLDEVDRVIRERQDWTDQRVLRWAKLMGLLEPKTYPWKDASNVHIPLLLQYVLRQWADLHNAVLGLRPVIEAVAKEPRAIDAVEPVTGILDHQVFVENDGAAKLDRGLFTFLWDGTFVSVQTWVTDWRTHTEVSRLPIAAGEPILPRVMDAFERGELLPGATDWTVRDPEGRGFDVTTPGEGGRPETRWRVEVYDSEDEGALEVEATAERRVFEGPVFTHYELDDVVVPLRSENPQPIGPDNPTGAPWISTLERMPIEEVERLVETKVFTHLSDTDLDAARAAASSRTPTADIDQRDALKRARDEAAGQAAEPHGPSDTEAGWVTLVQWFGPQPVGRSGAREEVLVVAIKETKAVCRVTRLAELLPGLPIRRPVAHETFIPTPHRFYGLGLVELLDPLVTMVHTLANQNIDNGHIANVPFGAIRRSMQGSREPIRLEPGLLIEVDTPAQDLVFPAFPQRDQTWSFNWMGLLRQDMDRLASTSALAFGQVPPGKASALRTMGTTIALLQQGAAQPQAILRRLMQALKTIYEQFHRLNVRYLPPRTRYRKFGVPAQGADAYGEIAQAADLDQPVSFEFEASLLKANRGLVAQALEAILGVLVNPLTIQAGLVDETTLYTLFRDYIRAQEQEPSRYLVKPAAAEGPALTAEEVVVAVLRGQPPQGRPKEALEVHYQKLRAFLQDPKFQFLLPNERMLLDQWLVQIESALAEAQRRARLAQAAQAFQQAMGQGQGGGTPTTIAAPPMQMETPTAAEAEGGAIGGSR